MKELLPTQTGKLKIHKDVKENLFSKYKLEKQIDELYKSNIKLSSSLLTFYFYHLVLNEV